MSCDPSMSPSGLHRPSIDSSQFRASRNSRRRSHVGCSSTEHTHPVCARPASTPTAAACWEPRTRLFLKDELGKLSAVLISTLIALAYLLVCVSCINSKPHSAAQIDSIIGLLQNSLQDPTEATSSSTSTTPDPSSATTGAATSTSSQGVVQNKRTVSSSNSLELNFEETDDCMIEGGVPVNLRFGTTTKFAEITSWAMHKNGNIHVMDKLEVFTNQNDPGSRMFIELEIPKDIFPKGKVELTLTIIEGDQGSQCNYHQVDVFRLQNDEYKRSIENLATADDMLDKSRFFPGKPQSQESVDLSLMIYGRLEPGQTIYLMFVDVNQRCRTVFASGNGQDRPLLKYTALDYSGERATYGFWGPYSKCRLPCKSDFNYQCRQRPCYPGVGDYEACEASKMLERQACSDTSLVTPCSCADINSARACPANSTCTESIEGGPRCVCEGGFERESAGSKTICRPATTTTTTTTTKPYFAGVASEVGSESVSSSSSCFSKETWIIIGVSGGVILLCVIALLCMGGKKRQGPSVEGPAPGMGGGYWPPQAAGIPPGLAGPTINSAFAVAPGPPMTRPMGPGRRN